MSEYVLEYQSPLPTPTPLFRLENVPRGGGEGVVSIMGSFISLVKKQYPQN